MRLRVGPADLPRSTRACCQRLHARGLQICVWINPYIAQRSRAVRRGHGAGLSAHDAPNGDVWQWDQLAARHGARRLHQPGRPARGTSSSCAALLDMGVDCFKTDFGERIPTDVVYHDGSDPERMHNYYTYLYNQTVFELLEQRRGEGEAVVFARSATAGVQQFPVHWGGDCSSTFESMAESLRGGLSLALSGFGFWSHDIGGFEGHAAAGRLQALDRLRPAVVAQPPARQRVLPRAVALRRGVGRRAAPLHPAEVPADALPVRRRRRGPRAGAPDDAGHGAGVPRRSGLRVTRPPVHARRDACWSPRSSRTTGSSRTMSRPADGPACSTGTWWRVRAGIARHMTS